MRSSRFAPWVLLGCLIFVASCGKDKSVPSSGAVGHVVVVKGEVTAQRANQEMRPVRVDETVYADDTITTGPNASVEILLTHNGALWELGESAERRIDKGIAFRATKKGAGPLAAKEAPTTAAAGRSTTREAADSVGTVVGFESDDDTDEVASAKEEAADEPLPDKRRGATDVDSREETAKAERAGAAYGGKGNGNSIRGRGRRASSTQPKRVEGSDNIIADAVVKPVLNQPMSKPMSKPMPKPGPSAMAEPVPPQPAPRETKATSTSNSANDESMPEVERSQGDFDASKPAADEQPQSGKKQTSPQAQQIAHVDALVRKCHKTHGGAGTLGYAIRTGGALQITRSNASLKPVIQCLRSALKASPAPNKSAVTSTLRLE